MVNSPIFRFSITKQPPFGNLTVDLRPGLNFLIGKNGSGKSKILQALVTDGKGDLQTNQQLRNRQGIQVKQPKNSRLKSMRYSAQEWSLHQFEVLRELQSSYASTNKVLQLMEQEKLEHTTVTDNVDYIIVDGKPKTVTTTSDSHKIRGEELIEQSMLSSGTLKLFGLLNWRPTSQPNFININRLSSVKPVVIFTIDEPENSLHPNLEKRFPEFLMQKYFELKKDKLLRNFEIFIVVATHSPFILKGVSQLANNASVFVLPDTHNSELINGALEPVDPIEAIISGNMNLGVSIGDFLPEKLLIAENSIAVLIQNIEANLKIETPSFFVTNTGGDSNLETRVASVFGINKMLKSMSKNFPDRHIFAMSYTIFVDDQNFKTKLETQWKNVGETEIKVEVINIGERCLEDSYPLDEVNKFIAKKYPEKSPWDGTQSINKYLSDELGIQNHKEKGVFKAGLAKQISSRVNSKEKLKSSFPQLYDFLIP